jgi:acetolactate synthase I/II/III large subunit
MNGAEALIHTALMAGAKTCFANPGTTEIPLLQAMDAVPGMRSVLGLFEGVCTGAADGYARMAGRPALTLLHHGPGFANGIANLHNARRAHSPIVNLIGQHTTWHIAADSPLTSDIEGLARPVSAWVSTVHTAQELPAVFSGAISAALLPPGQIASLIVPMDCQTGECPGPMQPQALKSLPPVPASRIKSAAQALRSRKPAAILMGGNALRSHALSAAGKIAAAMGCRLFCSTFPARLERGAGLPLVEKLPYFPEQALERLSSFAHLILVSEAEPVAFFGYPGLPSRLVPEQCSPILLAEPGEDGAGALEALVDELRITSPGTPVPSGRPHRPKGELSPRSLGEAIASVQPEGLILVDEAVTSGLPYFLVSGGAPRFTYLGHTGGSIGMGLPLATGAAIACPDRKVLAFQADGSAMYTLQALWTQAREGLDVTTIICANRSYRILQIELARAGAATPGPQAAALTDLSHPELNWVDMAQGMGVPGTRVETADLLVQHLERAFSERGPHLIEAML